jgi:hypothetical protein
LTTKVVIKNEEGHGERVLVQTEYRGKGDVGWRRLSTENILLAPGQSHETHVWFGKRLVVVEVSPKEEHDG